MSSQTKRELGKLARELGCVVDWDRWEIEAPSNHRFADGGPHVLVFEPFDWDDFTWEDQYRDAVNRLKCGLEQCHCGDCDAQEAP